MALQVNLLNAIPITIFVIVTCCMSYWHGRAKQGYRVSGLIYTIVLGSVGQILVGLIPIFL